MLLCILTHSGHKNGKYLAMENGPNKDSISACDQSRYDQNSAYISCAYPAKSKI